MAGDRWVKTFQDTYDPLKAGSIDGTDTEPHDRGIIRALNTKYKPNKSVVGDADHTLFVGRLNFNTTEDKIRQEFSAHGKLRHVRLVRDIVTGYSKGYAFVEYEDDRDTSHAYYEMNKAFIDGNSILVDYEQERKLKGWVPRRLGGGIGGKKESGQLRFGGRDKSFVKPIVVSNFGRKIDVERSSPGPSRDHKSRNSPDLRSRGRDFERDRGNHGNRRRSRSRDRDRSHRHKRSRSRSPDRKPYFKRSRSRSPQRKHSRRSRDRDSRKGKY